MDAWDTLLDGSTIDDGDAWEHLNAQGGESGAGYFVLVDGMEVEMVQQDIEVMVAQPAIEVTIDVDAISVEVDQSPLEVEI